MVVFLSPWLYLDVRTPTYARSFAMKKIVVSLFAILAGSSLAVAADTGCDAFKWPVAREQALFQSAPAAQPGAALTVGQAVDFSLAAVDTVSFEVPPDRAPAAGTFGATASVTVPPDGELQFSLSDEAWIDVVQDGRAVKLAAFSGEESRSQGGGADAGVIRRQPRVNAATAPARAARNAHPADPGTARSIGCSALPSVPSAPCRHCR